jgi:N6-adenosine-specific RNA methylase IME4
VKRYRTIYADPPWYEQGGGGRGANAHYPLFKTPEIATLPVQELADDNCHLYLWVTNNFLPDGLHVMTQWGFRYVTKIVWVKEGHVGLGQYFRGKTEDCLFGVRGRLPFRRTPEGRRAQGITAIYAPRTRHSEKPDDMRQVIELVSHEPRIELFARRRYPGWDVWGNEIPGDVVLIRNHFQPASALQP